MMVTVSEKAELIAAIHLELEQIEKLQLKVGEEMSKLLFEQMRLAEKSRALLNMIERTISRP